MVKIMAMFKSVTKTESNELLWLSFVDKLTVTVDQIGKICFYILPLFSTMLLLFNGAQNGCTAE